MSAHKESPTPVIPGRRARKPNVSFVQSFIMFLTSLRKIETLYAYTLIVETLFVNTYFEDYCTKTVTIALYALILALLIENSAIRANKLLFS